MTEAQVREGMRLYLAGIEAGMAEGMANASPATKRCVERLIVVQYYRMSELLKSHIK
jgi:hypothetical protein